MNVEFINPFLESLLNVLSTMAQQDARAGRPMIKQDDVANGDVTGLVGEITNKVTGGANRLLADKGYHFDLAIPAVVSGKNHKIIHKSHGPKVIVPFTVAAGVLYVEICFEDIPPK